MADIGLPGSLPVSQYSTPTSSAEGTYYAGEQNIQINTAITGTVTYSSTHNYLYKCPAANSGIKNSQVLWF